MTAAILGPLAGAHAGQRAPWADCASGSVGRSHRVHVERKLSKLDVELVNNARTARGRRALSIDRPLRKIAERHARQMAHRGRLCHNASLAADLNNAGICWHGYGENIGFASYPNGRRSVRTIHRAYMAEGPGGGHYENIVNRSFQAIGDAVVKAKTGYWEVEDFLVPC
jgi:uncharacterized protein YkwD